MINHIPDDLFYGIQVSDCLLPCLRTTATVRKKMTSTMSEEWVNGLVGFNFDNEVRVRKTSVDKFSFLVSLNFFGSNLGLHQILEWRVGMVGATRIIIRCRRYSFSNNIDLVRIFISTGFPFLG